MSKIVKYVLKSRIFLAFMIAITFFFLLGIDWAMASGRSLNFRQFMERSMISRREVEVNGRIFDVFIDQESKTITVQGNVNDWEEKKKVEEYFRLRSPSDYQVNYEFYFLFR